MIRVEIDGPGLGRLFVSEGGTNEHPIELLIAYKETGQHSGYVHMTRQEARELAASLTFILGRP